MTYCHNNPAVATTNTSLIVAGGWRPQTFLLIQTRSQMLKEVEVMDTQTLQWSTVASLPFPLQQATATICGGRLYIGGGYTTDSGYTTDAVQTNSVVMCGVKDLLQGVSLATRLGLSSSPPVWRQVASLPVVLSSLVTFQGQLLAVGGGITYKTTDSTSEVMQYDATTNSWRV